eukprot:Phypoly_transcript_10906.p1 GENE.Phypoly_transcript_10906~~Phypoly_transcript_10906.p1  ORF type:complete len:368 (+),score=45.52 Phypoly_transcript_10906:85-1188(+)
MNPSHQPPIPMQATTGVPQQTALQMDPNNPAGYSGNPYGTNNAGYGANGSSIPQFPHHTTNPQGTYHQSLLRRAYVLDYPPRRGSRRNLIKSFIADWIIVCLILLCCIIWFAEPPGQKHFRLDDPNLSYPDISAVVFPSWLLHVLYWLPPLIILTLAQIWLRNFSEWHHTALSFVETIAMAYMTTTFLMWAVGGLRPSWLSVCRPSVSVAPGFPYQFFDDSVCTVDSSTRRTAQQSFPSGHAATIFASYSWLVLYLNAKWKVFDGNAHAWKLITFLPLLFAVWISFSRVNDAKHTQFDVCAGITLGIFLAIIGYRLNFASLFGPDNHVPLRLTWDEPPLPVRHITDIHPKHVDYYPEPVPPGGLPLQ